MLRIRLTRKGAKKKPFYRIVVTEQRSARDGSYLQALGYYNPRTDPVQLQVDLSETEKWIKRGAQPSETVGRLLRIAKARQLQQIPVTPSLNPSAKTATAESENQIAGPAS